MSRKLIAKDTNTITRNTSLGEVSFTDGVATVFTDEQAAHFVDNFGYTLEGVPKASADTKDLPPEVKKKAEEVLKNAHTEAENIVTKAKEDGKKIVDEAEEDAKKIVDEAEIKAQKIIDGAKVEKPEDKSSGGDKTEIEIPDETTPYPKLMKIVKDYEIDTKGSKKAADVLAAILADPRFKPKIEE